MGAGTQSAGIIMGGIGPNAQTEEFNAAALEVQTVTTS